LQVTALPATRRTPRAAHRSRFSVTPQKLRRGSAAPDAARTDTFTF
jgi:hypothetical protein